MTTLVWAALLIACKEGPGPSGADTQDTDGHGTGTGTGTETHTTTTIGTTPTSGGVPIREPDEVFEGDLSQGTTVNLDWADDSTVACFPQNENTNFDGNHLWFETTQPASMTVYLRVTPASGVDVSLYAIENNSGYQYPPNVQNVFRCETAFDQAGDSNPGEAEVLVLAPDIWTGNDYDVLLGVAGANGTLSGAFTLEVWFELVE